VRVRELIDGDWVVGRKWAGDSKGDIRRLIYEGNSGGISARGCCGRWNRVEGRRLCRRVNGLGRWKRRIEEARHTSKKLEEFEVRHLVGVVELSNKLQLHEPKQSTGHRLTGLSFRMAWLQDFEPS
jgi:hypothetical protein